MNLIEETERSWQLTDFGRELIKAVSDPTMGKSKPEVQLPLKDDSVSRKYRYSSGPARTVVNGIRRPANSKY